MSVRRRIETYAVLALAIAMLGFAVGRQVTSRGCPAIDDCSLQLEQGLVGAGVGLGLWLLIVIAAEIVFRRPEPPQADRDWVGVDLADFRYESEDDRAWVGVDLTNDDDEPLCVLAEPYGEDFWILPGQTLTFSTRGEAPEVDWYDDGASVWATAHGAWEVQVTDADGEPIECGHQRPPGTFETPQTNWLAACVKPGRCRRRVGR